MESVPSQSQSHPLLTMQEQRHLMALVPSPYQSHLVESPSHPLLTMQKQRHLMAPVPSQSQSHLVESVPTQSQSQPLQKQQKREQCMMEFVQSQETQSTNEVFTPMVTLFRRRKPAGFYSRLKNNLKPLRRDPLRLLHTRINPKPSFAHLINCFPLKDEDLRKVRAPTAPGKYCHPLLRDLVWKYDATTSLMAKAIRGFSCDYYATNN